MSTAMVAADAVPWLDSEHGTLHEVPLFSPVYYKWAPSNSIVLNSLNSGKTADCEAARLQHAQMAVALERFGVTCRYLDADPALHYQTYTRDSSVMTPWGLLLCQMARPARRGEWTSVLGFARRTETSVWKTVRP